EMGAVVPQIVGAHHRRVAPGIAAAEPALFEHGDIGDAVVLGEVIGGGGAVLAGADDDDVVLRLRRRIAPGALPAAMAGERIAGEAEERVAHQRAALRRSKPRPRSAMRSSMSSSPAWMRRVGPALCHGLAVRSASGCEGMIRLSNPP